MTRFLYFEPFSGASGDMLLGALLGLGYPLEELRNTLSLLGLSGWSIEVERVMRGGLSAHRALVTTQPEHHHRHLSDIDEILRSSKLPLPIIETSLRVFQRLAEAEAQVHGTSPDKIHFHEVGATDAILDIVGTVSALDHFQADQLFCSSFPVGEGIVRCEHGEMPNPAPATMLLLRDWPLHSVSSRQELLTPTGAALLTTLAKPGRPWGEFRFEKSSFGAGTRDSERANVLRATLGCFSPERVWESLQVLECHLDDCTGEKLGFVLEKLYLEGALEVSFQPVTMKKSRPGHILFCLSRPNRADKLADLILTETTSLGVRRSTVERLALQREFLKVSTPYGELQVKKATDPSGRVRFSPEFEQARKLALQASVPLHDVYTAAVRSAELTSR